MFLIIFFIARSQTKSDKKKGMHKACLWTFDSMHQMEKTAKV